MTKRTMNTLTLSALAAAALLAGCSQLPTYQRPEQAMPIAWPMASDTSHAAPALWQDFVADPVLRTLVNKALQNNRDLRIATLQIEQARAQHQISRSAQFPTVNAGLAGNRQSVGESEPIASTYTAGLIVSSWEIDFFGRLASLKEAALAQYLATEEARKSTQISLVASVVSGWLSLQTSEALLKLTEETLASREEALRLTQLRFDNGSASALDLRLAQSVTESARTTLAQQQRQRALDLNALGLLVGQPITQALSSAELQPQGGQPELAFNAVSDVPVGLPSSVLLERPDIRAAEQGLVAANARIGAARAAFFPRISLTASVGSASSELSGLFTTGTTGWTLAPQLLLPIFDAGANRAGLESARAGQDIAVAQYEKAIQTAFREVNDALAGRDTLVRQLQAQDALVRVETDRLRLSELRLNQGVTNRLEVLDAQRSLFSAQQSALQTRLALAQNRVALYKALGGGWQAAG